ncbi:MAG: AMP-binding protein [Terriglobales bacterium]
MSFLSDIFAQLNASANKTVLRELRENGDVEVTGAELLRMISQAREFLGTRGLRKGERCALLAANSVRWVAMDLAIMAEGLIVVPLYARQAPEELVAMMKDCGPSLIVCGDGALRDAVEQNWEEAPERVLLEDVFQLSPSDFSQKQREAGQPHTDKADPVAIIYTSGTSGEAKGVVLDASNLSHMLGCTSERLDSLMEKRQGQDRVYHYLPFCFAGSWILLLTCLQRGSELSLNTDLNRIPAEMAKVEPDYFLNVPQLLERMRKAVDEQIAKKGGFAEKAYNKARVAWLRKREGSATFTDSLWLKIGNALVFPTIRKKMAGGNLRALICGSAPLTPETQLYFMSLGIPVLQVYGLTETTAICTMDIPGRAVPGRVGQAIEGIEMKLAEGDEIVVRGPNIFSGYWNRPQETTKALREGWFHTGDQGETDAAGNWRIIGRIKNLLILGSGHNIAPEPIEDEILQNLTEATRVVLMGNGRGYLSAIVTGKVSHDRVQETLDELNEGKPHYKQVRAFYVHPDPFSIENGLLTANGKLKRDLIAARFKTEIEAMYAVKRAG